MTEIKLPPLPDPDGYIRDGGPKGILIFQREPLSQTEIVFHSTDVVWRYNAMQAYARASIEADRRARQDEAEKLSRAKHYGNGYQDGWNSALDKAADLVGGSSMTSRHAAAAIRALKEQS